VCAFALLAAACGGGGSNGSSSGPIKVGFLLPLTGNFASNGKSEQAGWNLGLKKAGDTVNGRKIQTLFADTAADPNQGLSQARQLIDNQHVDIMIGPLAANVGLAVRAKLASSKVPSLYAAACPVELATTQKANNVMLTGWTCDQPSLPFGKYAYDVLGYRHITTIGLDFAFGWQVVGGFLSTFKAAGGTVDKQIWNPTTTTDFSSYVSQIPRSTQAVFALESGAGATKFLQAYKQFGLKGKIPLLGGGTLTDYSSLGADTPDIAEGVITALQYADGIDTAENKAFVEAYKAEAGTYPSYYAESGYATAKLVVGALQKLNGDTSDKGKLLEALKSSPIQAARGPVSIESGTNSPVQNVYIRKVQVVNGALRNVAIQTFQNVQPWGSLPQDQWQKQASHYTRNSFQ
jgi:branched-chain amino acid transport system substrate-binding protein